MFSATPIYNVGGTVTFGLLRPAILPDSTDQSFTVTQQNANNLQAVATTLYGNPQLWWVIAELNSMVDPLTESPAGTVLRVATQERVNSILTQ